MARRKSSKAHATSLTRTSSNVAKVHFVRDPIKSSLGPNPYNGPKSIFADVAPAGDRRRWNPTNAYSGPYSTTRKAKQLRVGKKSHQLKFKIPRQVALCVRRAVRKQVIHALHLGPAAGAYGKAKKLARLFGKRKKRRGPYSSIGC